MAESSQKQPETTVGKGEIAHHENTVGKGENARDEQFLLFTQYFLKHRRKSRI